jgi:hypothetical protein
MIRRYSDVLADLLDAAMKLAQFADLDVNTDKIKLGAGCICSPAPQSE